MVVLVAILKDYRHVEELVLGYLELGIAGATVVEARGMGQMLVQEHPLFNSVRDLFPGAGADSHMVISVTDGSRATRGLALLGRITQGIARGGAGIGFTLPIGQAVGLATPYE